MKLFYNYNYKKTIKNINTHPKLNKIYDGFDYINKQCSNLYTYRDIWQKYLNRWKFSIT